MHSPIAPHHLAPVVGLADAVLRRTVRWGVDDPADVLARARAGEPMIFACRHGELWPLLWVVRDCDVSILASRSGDGELLARILRGQGFGLLRGSSSAQASAAARGALRLLRRGGRVGLAVDGPKGPRGVVQDGVLRLAQRSDTPIVALRRTGGTPWIAPGSWDRFEIPRPGDRVTVRVMPPLHVPASESGLQAAGDHLATLLDGARPEPRDVAPPAVGRWSGAPADAG